MSESTLSLNYSDLICLVGFFLGYGEKPTEWTESESATIDRCVQSGYRQFLYPPAVQGVQAGYEWSFLRLWASITTVQGEGEQALPDDFGRFIEGFYFPSGSGFSSVLADVGEGRISELRQQRDAVARPDKAAIRFKSSDGLSGQRKEVMWFPRPDSAYVLSYKYEAYVGNLSAQNPYPLGGMKHAELLKASCLAVAETDVTDIQGGPRWDAFVRQLVASVIRDRREGAKHFGNVGSEATRPGGGLDYTLRVCGFDIQ